MASIKPVHTLVLDTGAIIKNEPSVSTLLNKAEDLVTVPEVLSEIRDAATRSRFETTLKPFLTVRSPSPRSLQFVKEFARRTGDLSVLSQPDIRVIALTYELECERNGGDWRLRRVPGQQRLNGSSVPKVSQQTSIGATKDQSDGSIQAESEGKDVAEQGPKDVDEKEEPATPDVLSDLVESAIEGPESLVSNIESLDVGSEEIDQAVQSSPKVDSAQNSSESQTEESDSDAGGWITPSNLKKKQAEDASRSSTKKTSEPAKINLNLLSPSTMARVKHLKTHVLRCHACFQVCKDMSKQFCPRCGGATLTRVTCSTDSNGEFKLHLKKNMQWNLRGNKYSIPKPVHGSANGRISGGGKGGWGHDLILAEDQKEYQNAERVARRQRERNLMDEDYLPSILTGDRGKTGGRIRVGAGKNVNSRKR